MYEDYMNATEHYENEFEKYENLKIGGGEKIENFTISNAEYQLKGRSDYILKKLSLDNRSQIERYFVK